jgi:hypothetical protein
LKILALALVFLKDLVVDPATTVLPMVVTAPLPEIITATVPPLALMETHQTKPRRQPTNPTRQVGQKDTVDDLVLIPITVEEMVQEMVHRPVPL